MSKYNEQPINTFIVRFWWNRQGEGLDQSMHWHGRVEHIQSGERMNFRHSQQLINFIEHCLSLRHSPSADLRE